MLKGLYYVYQSFEALDHFSKEALKVLTIFEVWLLQDTRSDTYQIFGKGDTYIMRTCNATNGAIVNEIKVVMMETRRQTGDHIIAFVLAFIVFDVSTLMA